MADQKLLASIVNSILRVPRMSRAEEKNLLKKLSDSGFISEQDISEINVIVMEVEETMFDD